MGRIICWTPTLNHSFDDGFQPDSFPEGRLSSRVSDLTAPVVLVLRCWEGVCEGSVRRLIFSILNANKLKENQVYWFQEGLSGGIKELDLSEVIMKVKRCKDPKEQKYFRFNRRT